VWVETGFSFGLGHLSRGLAVAEALASQGVSYRFAMAPDATALAWLRAAGQREPFVLADHEHPLPDVLAAAVEADVVVADVRRPLERTEVRALRGSGRVVLIDNAGPGVAEADVVVAPFGEASDDRWLVGPSFLPLRRIDRRAPGRRRTGAGPTVLVSMGATDPGGLAVPVVEALAQVRLPDLSTRVVANPMAPVWASLADLLHRHDLGPAHAVEPGGLGAHLADADVAVVAFGVTVYEALAMGIPTIALCRTSGDVAHARTLEARGALRSLPLHWGTSDVVAVVEEIAGDAALRAEMSRAGRAVSDGRGAERIASRIVRLLVEKGRDDAGRRLRG